MRSIRETLVHSEEPGELISRGIHTEVRRLPNGRIEKTVLFPYSLMPGLLKKLNDDYAMLNKYMRRFLPESNFIQKGRTVKIDQPEIEASLPLYEFSLEEIIANPVLLSEM